MVLSRLVRSDHVFEIDEDSSLFSSSTHSLVTLVPIGRTTQKEDERDDGWQSTAALLERTMSHSPRTSRSLKRRQPKVRFHPDQVTATLSTAQDSWDNVASCTLWYQPEDYVQFKANFVSQARTMMRPLRKSLLETFQACCGCAHDDEPEARDANNVSCLEDSDSTLILMMVGLERMAAKQIFQDKLQRRILLVQTVQGVKRSRTTQQQPPLLPIQSNNHTCVLGKKGGSCCLSPLSSDQEHLRLACEHISLPSRLFAAKLAARAAKAA